MGPAVDRFPSPHVRVCMCACVCTPAGVCVHLRTARLSRHLAAARGHVTLTHLTTASSRMPCLPLNTPTSREGCPGSKLELMATGVGVRERAQASR